MTLAIVSTILLATTLAATALKVKYHITVTGRKGFANGGLIAAISTPITRLYSSQWGDLDAAIDANKNPKRAAPSDKFPMYLGNLPFDYTSDSLKELMNSKGIKGVASTRIVLDKKDGKSRGFGYVDFKSKDDVNNAILELSGLEVDNRKIKMDAAESADGPKRGRRGGGITGDYSLFLGNLPFQMTEGDIEDYVRETIGSGPEQKYEGQLKVRLAIADNRSRGFAHVDFIDNDALNSAMSKLMGTRIRDRNVIVDRAAGRGRRTPSRESPNIDANNVNN